MDDGGVPMLVTHDLGVGRIRFFTRGEYSLLFFAIDPEGKRTYNSAFGEMEGVEGFLLGRPPVGGNGGVCYRDILFRIAQMQLRPDLYIGGDIGGDEIVARPEAFFGFMAGIKDGAQGIYPIFFGQDVG